MITSIVGYQERSSGPCLTDPAGTAIPHTLIHLASIHLASGPLFANPAPDGREQPVSCQSPF